MPVINQITLILETTYKYRNPKSVEKENSRGGGVGYHSARVASQESSHRQHPNSPFPRAEAPLFQLLLANPILASK
jgi:hypothetical protein